MSPALESSPSGVPMIIVSRRTASFAAVMLFVVLVLIACWYAFAPMFVAERS